MNIIKHAQSCFVLKFLREKVLIDPGTYVFEKEGLTPQDFRDIDFIVITHEHADHFDVNNVIEIIKLAKPKIYCSKAAKDELENHFDDLDIKEIEQVTANVSNDFSLRGVRSIHGPLPNQSRPPVVEGVVLRDSHSNASFYHPGDSIKLDIKATVIATPIGGVVTLNEKDAAVALNKIRPEMVIPMHYDNPKFQGDPEKLKDLLATTPIRVEVLNWGESVEVK